jgi:thiosulfate/3-mercaptopyruvate sulfurtransferase
MLLNILQSLAFVLLPVSLLDDGDARPTAATLVGFEELRARLEEPDLRLIDARPRPEYEKGHIPGAVWVDAKAVEAMAARPGALTDRTAWEAWIRPLGIGPETKVLVYDANRQLDAARLWWLLGYLGVDRVGLVDGNFPAWAAEGRPVAVEVPEVEPRDFPVKLRSGRRASRSDVLAAIDAKSMRIIDARTEAEYTGEEKKSRRGGHMPEACHLEWKGFVTPEGKFLPVEELRAKLEKAGVKPGEPVITHCQGGGRASVDAFVFERLGHPARNYYESWGDWGNADDTPIETGPLKK